MESYKLVYLEQFRNDLKEIAVYITNELKSPQAAAKLVGNIISAAEGLKQFPYAQAVYVPIKPLKYEYRKLIVENHMLFYRIDETEKEVVITRIIYARRNLMNKINE